MKTCQGTGYFQQVYVRLLLCFISSVVFAASAYAFTPPNNINACYDCHGSPIIPGGTDIRPVDSAYRNITTGGFVGSHRTHIPSPTTASITCTPCHGVAPTSVSHRDGMIHFSSNINGNTAIKGTYSKGLFFNQTSAPVLGTCNNIYCHAVFTTPASTPTWGTSAGCAACHASSPVTGAHTVHMAAPVSSACGTCHTGATVDVTGGPGHGNNLINVSLYTPTTVAKHAPGAYTATCTTACHNAANTTAVATPNWGVIATCATCHAASPVTGDHTKHMAAPVSAACGACHAGATAGTSGGSGHGDQNIDVNGTLVTGYPANKTKGTAFSRCTTVCHNAYSTATGILTPTWGVAATCASCHLASPVTGTHTLHINAPISASCATCHTGATAGVTGGNGHGDGNVDVALGYPASVTRHAAGTYTGTCSTTCHSAFTTPAITPTWGAQAGCAACHALSPATGAHTTHLTAVINANCGTCHTGATISVTGGPGHGNNNIDVAQYTPTSIAKHAAGVYTATCSTACHNATGTTAVATTSWGVVSTCATCHAASPTSGDHTKHLAAVVGATCGTCHAGATAGVTGGNGHGDQNIDVAGALITAFPANKVKGSAYTTCTTICHNAYSTTVGIVTPSWGVAATCASCHAASPVTGDHTKHIAIGATCASCHAGATAGVTGGNGHGDGNIDVNGTLVTGYPANKTRNTAFSTCTTSCHNAYSPVTGVTTPTWGVAATCASCHVASPTTGSHTSHINAPTSAACSACHTGATAGVTGGAAHGDGNIDVINGYPAGVARHTAGTYSGTCSTASCHGSNSPVWGVGIGNNTCTKCHGIGTVSVTAANRYVVAPPNSVAGTAGTVTGTGQVSNNTKVGAHQTHLQFFNGFSNYSTVDFRCQSCHGTLPVVGNHASGSSAPAFQGLATRGGKAPTWSAATFSCSNTYCHNPAGATGGLNAANAGTRTFVSWTASSYLGDTRKTELNCNRCHKSPGNVAGAITITSGTSHASFTIASDCSGCHGHNGDNAGPAGQRHMDGIKYGGGSACDSCHSYDTADWATATHNYGGTVANEGIGAHAKHITYIKARYGITLNPTADMTAGYNAGNAAAVCGVCHSLTLGDHMTGGRVINFNNSVARQFGSNNNPATWYTGVSTTSSSVNQKTCSNLNCHYGTTPLWSTY